MGPLKVEVPLPPDWVMEAAVIGCWAVKFTADVIAISPTAVWLPIGALRRIFPVPALKLRG